MSEYRQDPLTKNWVIIAAHRGQRPDEFAVSQWQRSAVECPFCAGHEAETPPEIARYLAPGREEWLVRVVPNKYPAVHAAANGFSPTRYPFRRSAARGAHEVVIESPTHALNLTDLPQIFTELAFQAYADRLLEHRRRGVSAYGVVFKNSGAEAGASLEHVHSQVLTTSLVPPALASLHARWKRQARTVNAFQKFLEDELTADCRVVARTSSFVAICPFASRVPFEMRVLPLERAPYFERTSRDQLAELAQLMYDLLRRIDAVTQRGPYNLIIHTAPFDTPPHDYYHWHMEIVPRVTRTAGFEWGSGCYINPMAPEHAAERLRVCLEREAGV